MIECCPFLSLLSEQLYDCVCSKEVTISNTGKVGLDYIVTGVGDPTRLAPGEVAAYPTTVSNDFCFLYVVYQCIVPG